MTKLKVLKRAGSWISTHPLSPGIRAGDILWMSATAPVNLDAAERQRSKRSTSGETCTVHCSPDTRAMHTVWLPSLSVCMPLWSTCSCAML